MHGIKIKSIFKRIFFKVVMNLQNDHTLVLHEMLIGGDPQQGRRSNSKIVCKSFPVIETVKSMQYIIRNM